MDRNKEFTVALVEDDLDLAPTITEKLRDEMPQVSVFRCPSESELLDKIRSKELSPEVVLLNFDLSGSPPGSIVAGWLLLEAPDLTIIGYCSNPDEARPPSRQTPRQLFLEAGAVAVVDIKGGLQTLIRELENWLDEDTYNGWVSLATLAIMAAFLIGGLLTIPGWVISFLTFPLGFVLLLAALAGRYFGLLREDMANPLIGFFFAYMMVGLLFFLVAGFSH